MRLLLAVTASLTLTHPAMAEDRPSAPNEPVLSDRTAPVLADPRSVQAVRLPGFAFLLANEAPIRDASYWQPMSDDDAWKAIARSTKASRQSARWRFARSLLGQDRSAEAYGVLAAMVQDDPDLALVPAHRLALGAALVGMGRHEEALDALSAIQLAQNPEACAWRLRAMAAANLNAGAMAQWSCARPAIASRTGKKRASFLLAAADAALAANMPHRALSLLSGMPQADPHANLIRGRALFQLGKDQDGRLMLTRAVNNGTPEQRVDARVSLLEGLVAHGKAKPQEASAELDRIAYSWRGGSIERRALVLRLNLAEARNDDRAALAAGAALFRYHPVGQNSTTLLAALQERLGSILSAKSKVALPEAAGLFWQYRDLSPSGAGGDFLVSELANRLQAVRLYDRAAELLDYQLMARAKDIAQGPLSVRVASLYILAGRPEDTMRVLRKTDGNLYPDTMIWARLRVEAVALNQLGRTDEALAVLGGVPDGGAIRDEIEWGRRNWQALAKSGSQAAPRGGRLSEVEQTIILRRAVALAMLGQEVELTKLRARFARGFAGQSTAAAFELLTGPVEALDPGSVTRAMAAIPAASPAGDMAALLAAEVQIADQQAADKRAPGKATSNPQAKKPAKS